MVLDKNKTKEQLRKYNIKPNITMGQNFLVNNDVLEKIIKAADLDKEDTILEVGPGLGVLTKELIKYSKKVIAIEKDEQMIEILKKELDNSENIEIIQGDSADMSAACLVSEPQGSHQIIAIQLDKKILKIVAPATPKYEPGQAIRLRFKQETLRFFDPESTLAIEA